MNSAVYSVLALRTAPDAGAIELTEEQKMLLLGGLGAADEAGEIAGLIKKHVFHGHPLDWEKLHKEIGDVLWYLNFLATLGGNTLDDEMKLNIEKLSKRYPEGFFSTERSMNRAPEDV